MNNYSDVLLKQQALLQRQLSILKPLRTLQSDSVGNLIHSYSEDYKASVKALQDVNERILEYRLLTDDTLRNLVYQNFDERLSDYVQYLLDNRDDLDRVQEIAFLCAEFPHLETLFNTSNNTEE